MPVTAPAELDEQLLHACEQVRRCRADGDSERLLYWHMRRESLLDARFAAQHGKDQTPA